jgi:predicted ATP-dependent protease
LTGTQGVMIPKANERHLMLKEEVVEAVKIGQFHVWSIETIEQGVELLTGMPAGTADKNGRFPKGTLYHQVAQALRKMYGRMHTEEEKQGAKHKKSAVKHKGGKPGGKEDEY